jgi:hypothetical protein
MNTRNNDRSGADPESVFEELIHEAAHYLPTQGPLGLFVHHNTLHAFEQLPFHEALEEAHRRFGASVYLPLDVFRAAWMSGRITDADLLVGLARHSDVGPAPRDTDIDYEILTHALEPRQESELRWLLRESADSLRLHSDLTIEQRQNLVVAGVEWFTAMLGCIGKNCSFGDVCARVSLGEPSRQNRPESSTDARSALRNVGLNAQEADAYMQWFANTRGVRAELLEKTVIAECDAFARLMTETYFLPANITTLRALSYRHSEALTSHLYLGLVRSAGLTASTRPKSMKSAKSINQALEELTGENPADLSRPFLIRFVAAYLDEGISSWNALDRSRGLWSAFVDYCSASGLREAWMPSSARLAATASAAAVECLTELGGTATWDGYLNVFLQELPGWAGMFHRLQTSPADRDPDAPGASVEEFAAIRLVLDRWASTYCARRHDLSGQPADWLHLANEAEPMSSDAGELSAASSLASLFQLVEWPLHRVAAVSGRELKAMAERIDAWTEPAMQRIWQEAYELRFANELTGSVCANGGRREDNAPAGRPRFQAVFCIDDREESFRRAFEELSEDHETLGAAGFFGIAMDYSSLAEPTKSTPLCPPVVTPAHSVMEHPLESTMDQAERTALRAQWVKSTRRASRSSANGPTGAVLLPILGAASAIPLFGRVIAPGAQARLEARLRNWFSPPPATRLVTSREHTAEQILDPQTRAAGFTLQEQVERVGRLITQMGVINFAPIIAMVGHGAHTTNNPHAAAYNCGACGGRRGGPNGRAFAAMANRTEVRELLVEQGIIIPIDTIFVGAEHDTCSDEVVWYDQDLVPESHRAEFEALKQMMVRTSELNALERCRNFASARNIRTPETALRHVESRAQDIGQARPELGHMTNASCIVGRRNLTRRLFLDRRAFLVSYDPDLDDEDGTTLEGLLAAGGPVCAGINLEYYFSCVDNQRFGAGTKLPHNLVSMLGVMDGAGSDLRTGLPRQMIEAHEPMRLLLMIEAPRKTVLRILERHAPLRTLVTNQWVRTVILEPSDLTPWEYVPGEGLVKMESALDYIPREATDSLDSCVGQIGLLSPALLQTPVPGAAMAKGGKQ